MSTNIAILIGVSDYKFEPQLPACAADVTDLGKLLAATKKYSEVLSVTSGTDSATLKTVVRSFFSKYQDEDMNEVFVYFSGHERCLLLMGDPGAGKSVALRHLASQMIERAKHER